jgi:hypothetical protein
MPNCCGRARRESTEKGAEGMVPSDRADASDRGVPLIDLVPPRARLGPHSVSDVLQMPFRRPPGVS